MRYSKRSDVLKNNGQLLDAVALFSNGRLMNTDESFQCVHMIPTDLGIRQCGNYISSTQKDAALSKQNETIGQLSLKQLEKEIYGDEVAENRLICSIAPKLYCKQHKRYWVSDHAGHRALLRTRFSA